MSTMPGQPLNVFDCPLGGIRLIEASAGTGKTWAICGLYLRLLLECRLDVQQILVVTFTNAATAELRDRVRTRIAETLARLRSTGPAAGDPFVDALLQSLRDRHGLDDSKMALRLDQALQNFDEASIFTIHGFCQRALADTPFASGMPMALELLTDDSALRLEVVHDFWRRQVAGDALAPALAAHLLARKDSPARWGQWLQRQLGKPMSTLRWPAALDGAAGVDVGTLAQAQAAARATWQAERDAIVEGVVEALPALNGNSYKPHLVRTAAEHWDHQLESTDPLAAPATLDKLHLLTAARLVPKKGHPPPRAHAFHTQAGHLLDLLTAAREALAIDRLRLLRQLGAEAPARLRALKRERRVVAFDDMLGNLHEALVGGAQPGLAPALRARFPAALIDEFQDTDPLQFTIFKGVYAVPAAPPLFFVGDPKQAIYSFRNADLHTYLQARAEAVAEYTLADNQRSTRDLLAALNGLFGANPQAFVLPGLGYQPVRFGAKPRPAWHDATLHRAPLQLWRLPQDDAGEPLPKQAARRAAAEAAAGEIARLLAGGQARAIRVGGVGLAGGDIAVLVRSHAQGHEMRRALAALGVGSALLSQASVFHSVDAEDLERVLAAILEPARDRRLRTALATGIFGLDAAGIEALSADEAGLLERVTRFTAYRDLWLHRGIGVMLRSLFSRERVHERLLSGPDGERRLTNLLHLAETLHEAAQQGLSPERQLRWLQSQRAERRTVDAAQLRLESDRNLVQILTIHRSKGLEYPVVFCPFLWDGHPGGAPATLEGREYHDADGTAVLDFRPDGDDAAAIKAQIARERAAENVRLIYVALTRAVQRCVLVVGAYSTIRGGKVTTTEGDRSRLNSLVAGAGLSSDAWGAHAMPPAQIDAAWQAFSAAHPGSVGLEALPAGPWQRVALDRVVPEAIAALPGPAAIAGAWWIGSYSSLTYGARDDADEATAAVDHDARAAIVASAEAVERSAALDPDDIVHFPRGPQAGNCLHAVLERADYADPASWPAAISVALREQPPGRVDRGTAGRLPAMLQRLLGDVVATRLPGGLLLSEVPRTRRLVELEFNLPVGHLTAGALVALLRAHRYPVPPLDFGVLEGYLRGFIDLVCEHDGRVYLIDWKSNHLGDAAADYADRPVARAMAAHGYHLQTLIYTLALHRYLQRRRPAYRYDVDFGGAMVMFVRGVRPGWRTADGAPTGVHADRPPLALIEQLSALLGDAGVSREAE